MPAIATIVLGWAAYAALVLAQPLLGPGLGHLAGLAVLVGIIAVIIVCAFGVVTQAEHLAHRLGEPYGTLVLTFSIVLIEVVLICAMLLGPGDHATVARDSVMAVTMIILNLVIGLCLVVGGLRYGGMQHNRTGTSTYIALIAVLLAIAFVLPGTMGSSGAFTPAQAIPVALLTVTLYAFFLVRQTGAQAGDFREVDPRALAARPAVGTEGETARIGHILRAHRAEIAGRLLILVLSVLPIILLSHDMSVLLDRALTRAGAPAALAGVVIATIVFLPETITALRAALAGEIQRVSNLTHGALVSTVGLTIPAVLVIAQLTGQAVVFAESPTHLVLLGASVALSALTAMAERVTPVHGAAHLVLFGLYGLALFT